MTAQEAFENRKAALRNHCTDLECAIWAYCDNAQPITWETVGDLTRFDHALKSLIATIRGDEK